MDTPSDWRVGLIRLVLLSSSILIGCGGFVLFLRYGAADGLDVMDVLRAGLILVSTFWLAWGAAQAFAGLTTRPPRPARTDGAAGRGSRHRLPAGGADRRDDRCDGDPDQPRRRA
ncbi:MAG: hypothetical protein NWR54_12925, partial [Paracoccaceae bacterium]|nr:hypothetical protein [Paracoccaceae bacterium]